MSEELKTRALRASDEVYEKFKEIASKEFNNQGQCLSTLISLYEIEQSKAVIPERKLEVDNFQSHMNSLTEMFVMSLQLNQDAELRIRNEFSSRLISKEQTIEDLQGKISSLTLSTNNSIDKLKMAEEDNISLNKENNALKYKITELEKEKEKLNENHYKSLFDKDQLNKVLTKQCTEVENKIESFKVDYEQMKIKMSNLNTIENEKDLLEVENKNLEKTNQELERRLIFEKEKALLEKDKDYQKEIERIKVAHQQEIDKYQLKIEKLLSRFEEEHKTVNNKTKEK